MQKNIRQSPDLLIVSDTPVWLNGGVVYALEPVVREIEHFQILFGKIAWMAYKQNGPVPQSTRIPSIQNLRFILVPQVGGHTFISKIHVLFAIPNMVRKLIEEFRKHEVIHLRGPSIPALLGIFISPFFPQKVFWSKYAGNWGKERKPLTYKIQKELNTLIKRLKVTINGSWPNQKPHVMSFENPCVSTKELLNGKQNLQRKSFYNQLQILFVGRIEKSKGFDLMLEILQRMNSPNKIKRLICVGEGAPEMFDNFLKSTPLPIEFTGAISRFELNKLYAESHLIILPSRSEGFPKVLMEAASNGCVPVSSNISSVGQYINRSNGLVFSSFDPVRMSKELDQLINDRPGLKKKAYRAHELSKKFTYERYIERIKEGILS